MPASVPAPARLPVSERRGLSRTEAAQYIGVSATTLDRLILAGQMPRPKRIGVRNIWDRRALDVAFDALSGETGATGLPDPESNEWDVVLRR